MTFSLSRRQALGVVLGGAIAAPSVLRAQAIKEIRIDWATYNPLSLILRDQKLLETEFEKEKIAIRSRSPARVSRRSRISRASRLP